MNKLKSMLKYFTQKSAVSETISSREWTQIQDGLVFDKVGHDPSKIYVMKYHVIRSSVMGTAYVEAENYMGAYNVFNEYWRTYHHSTLGQAHVIQTTTLDVLLASEVIRKPKFQEATV